MQISSTLSSFPNSSQTLQSQQSQYLRDANLALQAQEIEKPKEKNQEIPSPPPLGELPRQTYGLSVLEKMSDDEYRAFLRATAEMSESEKIFAAQSLYRLNEMYQNQYKKPKNPYYEDSQDFLKAFQNAHNELLRLS